MWHSNNQFLNSAGDFMETVARYSRLRSFAFVVQYIRGFSDQIKYSYGHLFILSDESQKFNCTVSCPIRRFWRHTVFSTYSLIVGNGMCIPCTCISTHWTVVRTSPFCRCFLWIYLLFRQHSVCWSFNYAYTVLMSKLFWTCSYLSLSLCLSVSLSHSPPSLSLSTYTKLTHTHTPTHSHIHTHTYTA